MRAPGRLAWRACGLLLSGVCLGAPVPADSIYQLKAQLSTQAALTQGLDLDRDHPTLISMFYGSCPAACPLLISAIQAYESQLDEPSRARLRVLLVSFDAARDTPKQLERIAAVHRADPRRWTFAAAPEPDARRLAALLGISYRHLPDGAYDHALRITLLDGAGRIVASTTTLIGDQAFAAQLRAATGSPRR